MPRHTKQPPLSIDNHPRLVEQALAAHAAGDATRFAVLVADLTTMLGRTGDVLAVRREVLAKVAVSS